MQVHFLFYIADKQQQINQLKLQQLSLKQFQLKVVQPFVFLVNLIYLNPTLACHTKANKKNNTGITGIISARGPNTAKTPGNLLNNMLSIELTQIYIFVSTLNTF